MIKQPRLQIMPIKKMIAWVNEHGDADVAILVASSYDVDSSQLPKNCISQIFDDIDYEVVGRSLTQNQAQKYADFIRTLPESNNLIICSCNTGESRSAALCAALCEYYHTDASWIWDSPKYHPNMLVFDLVTKEMGLAIDDTRMDELFWRNQHAFTLAINHIREVH